MNIQRLLVDDPIAQSWSSQTRKMYLAFSKRIANGSPLTIKIGKGGLSYYKETERGSVFVCHFNAAPRGQDSELGFADFRYDAVKDWLNLEETLTAFQSAASEDIQIKLNKLWCSLHFPLRHSETVADLFVRHIVSKVE